MFSADLVVFLLTIAFFDDFSGQLDQDLEFVRVQKSESSKAAAPFGLLIRLCLFWERRAGQILSQNTVPSLFLAIAMLEFILMLLDRMIYSSKSIRLKLLMQWVTVIGFHIWIFFVLPSSKQYVPSPRPSLTRARSIALPKNNVNNLNKRRVEFANNGILPVWYLFKCIYWYFSARQVHSVPTRQRFSRTAESERKRGLWTVHFQIRDGYLQFNINLFFLTRGYGAMNRYLCTLPVSSTAVLRAYAALPVGRAPVAAAVSRWAGLSGCTDRPMLGFVRTYGPHRPGLPPGPVRVRIPKRGGLDRHQNHPDVWPVAQD